MYVLKSGFSGVCRSLMRCLVVILLLFLGGLYVYICCGVSDEV